MKNSKKTNRNTWSEQELTTLIDCVHNAKTVGKGIQKAATVLGRTAAACNFKYYTHKPENHVIKNLKVTDTTTITFKIKSWSIKDGQLKMEIYKKA